MSTSAESAKAWTEEKQPTAEEVQQVLAKLEARIEGWQGDDQSIQGSIDAAMFLQGYLDQLATPEPETTAIDTLLDNSSLIPDHDPVQLTEDVKQQTFAALKAQLGKSVK